MYEEVVAEAPYWLYFGTAEWSLWVLTKFFVVVVDRFAAPLSMWDSGGIHSCTSPLSPVSGWPLVECSQWLGTVRVALTS